VNVLQNGRSLIITVVCTAGPLRKIRRAINLIVLVVTSLSVYTNIKARMVHSSGGLTWDKSTIVIQLTAIELVVTAVVVVVVVAVVVVVEVFVY
jgi:hypothetical protein